MKTVELKVKFYEENNQFFCQVDGDKKEKFFFTITFF